MNVHEERAKRWLCYVNHMTDEELTRTLQHGEIASLAAEFAVVEMGAVRTTIERLEHADNAQQAQAIEILSKSACPMCLDATHTLAEHERFAETRPQPPSVIAMVREENTLLHAALAKTQWWRLDAGYPSCGECHGFDPAYLSATAPEWRLARMGHRDECSVGMLITKSERQEHPIGFNQITPSNR